MERTNEQLLARIACLEKMNNMISEYNNERVKILEAAIGEYEKKMVSSVSETSKVFEPLVYELEELAKLRNERIKSLEKELEKTVDQREELANLKASFCTLEEKNRMLEEANSVQADMIMNYMEKIEENDYYITVRGKIIASHLRKLDEKQARIETLEGLVKEDERIILARNEEIQSLNGKLSGNQGVQSVQGGNLMERAMELGVMGLKWFPNTRIEVMNGDKIVLILNPHIKNWNVFCL